MTRPALVLVAHGTRSAAGQAEIRALAAAVQATSPAVHVELAWLEQAEPLLSDVLAALTGPAVVVPALLSTGYHVKIDIAAVVADRPDTVVAAQLGPDQRLTRAVCERLAEAGTAPDGGAVLLVASGSSDPEAAAQVATVCDQLARLTGAPVLARFLNDPQWRAGVPTGVRVANYLLAPGYFNDLLHARAAEVAAPVVAAPLGAHPEVVAVVLDRYEAAAAIR